MSFIVAVYKCGVPQSSILGPLLILLYINYIVDNIQSQVRLFADDTSMFLIVDNAIESADIINRDMNNVTSWSNKWLVSFNSQKTETMVISRKVYKPHHPSLAMNNQKLEDVEFH
jgi:ABC-type antimicrobial peptide transport system ATPase subunit